MGHAAADYFTTGFAKKLNEATSDHDKWLVRNQRKSLLAQHSAITSRDATISSTKPSPKVKISPTPRSDAGRRDRHCVSEVRRVIV
jgi:hypothetical protein